uniref:Chromosome 9 open reading frame 50 n=1 Tax=Otolemur garnettii TaxID=30611 RepID=H0X9Y8_OTOGA
MFRRQRNGGAQGARKRYPVGGDLRQRDPRLPRLTPSELRGARYAWDVAGYRIREGGSAWWQDWDAESQEDVRIPTPRRPLRSPVPPQAQKKRGVLESLLLPPLLSSRASRGSAQGCPGPGQCQYTRRRAAREGPGSLGSLLGEFLPSRFREFLRQLQQKCEEPLEPQTSPVPRHQRGVSEHCQRSHQCPNRSFLPDLWAQSAYFEDNLKNILLHQITLGPLKGDHSQLTTVNHSPYSAQIPKPKAVVTRNLSGEASRARRRCSPLRVRFADETVRDTALRYWERSCAVRQRFTENQTSRLPAVSDQLLGSVGRWLETLPKALYLGAREEALTSSSCWNFPSLFTKELQGHLSEDTPMNISLPFIPRATTPRQRGDLHNLMSTHNILEKESFLPSMVLQSVLRRSRPKDYQLFLPSMTLQRTQR